MNETGDRQTREEERARFERGQRRHRQRRDMSETGDRQTDRLTEDRVFTDSYQRIDGVFNRHEGHRLIEKVRTQEIEWTGQPGDDA